MCKGNQHLTYSRLPLEERKGYEMKALLHKLSNLRNRTFAYQHSGEFVNWLKCSECHGEDFYGGTLNGVNITVGVSRKVAVQCTVCLTCGHVFTLVDDEDLERLRAWKAVEDGNSQSCDNQCVQLKPDYLGALEKSAAVDM